jgi:hypothetical protein
MTTMPAPMTDAITAFAHTLKLFAMTTMSVRMMCAATVSVFSPTKIAMIPTPAPMMHV